MARKARARRRPLPGPVTLMVAAGLVPSKRLLESEPIKDPWMGGS